jgi:WD40 repeat protein
LLLDTQGTVWVTDFGLAKADDQQNLTQTGDILGTLRYMSPEAFEGKTDARSDVYSLGLTLYEMLAFRPPFDERERNRLIKQVIHEEPARLGLVNRAVPRDLATIVHKAIDHDPARRYATAADLAADLQRFLDDEPIQARRISGFERLARWSRRHPGVATSLAVIGLLVLMGLAGLGIALARFREQARAQTLLAAERDVERAKALEAKEQAETGRRKLALALTDMHTSQGLVAGQRGDPAQAVLWFANAARLAKEDPGRERLNRIRARTWARDAFAPIHGFRRAGDYGDFEQFTFHPSGRYLLVQGGPERGGPDVPSGLGIWDLEREQPLALPAVTATASSAAWSPDGRKLAVGCLTGSVTVAGFPGGDGERQFQFGSPVSWLSFSSDGRFLGIAAGSTARVWDCQARTFATRELRHPAALDALAFDPTGNRLVTACRDGLARIYAMPRDSAQPRYPPVPHVSKQPYVPGAKVTPPLFVAGGSQLLTRNEKDLLWWNADTGEKVRSVTREYMARMSLLGPGQADAKAKSRSEPLLDGAGCVITLSPDGKYLAVGEGRAPLGIAQLLDAETGRAILAFEYRNLVASLAFSPDGRRLLIGSTDRTAEIRSVPSGQLIGPPLVHPAGVYHVGFAPDGQSLATAQYGGVIRVWTPPRQAPAAYQIALDGRYSFAKVSPDGQYLLPTGMNRIGCTLASTRVDELHTGKPCGPLLQPGGIILDAAFAPDGRHVSILSGRSKQPSRVNVCDWRTGEPAFDPVSLPSEPRCLDYTPDGRRLAVFCAGGELLLFDAATGHVAARWQAPRQLSEAVHFIHGNGAVRFGPDGRTLFVWGLAKNVPAYDIETGKPRYELPHGDSCHGVRFSPDGRYVVTASWDKMARIWDYASGELAANPIEHPDWVFDAHFHQDGRHLLTTCRDGRARVWDWQSGRLVSPAFEHRDEVHAATFTPDGRWVVTASLDKTARVWDWHTGTPMAPPFVLGGKGLNVTISPDSRRAVIGGFIDALDIMDLDDLYAPDELDAEYLCLWAELLSGQRVHEGGVTNLTDKEWLKRWQVFRRRHPGYGAPAPMSSTN